MTDVFDKVRGALERVGGLKSIYYPYPQSFNELPTATYYEISNRPHSNADDSEYLSECIFVVDIWVASWKEARVLNGFIDEEMRRAGFIREFASDVPDGSKVKHRTMRYQYLGG